MIDFHCHVLPCMDDGSKSVEESLAMLRKLSEQGVTTVIATPHFYAEKERVDTFLERRDASYAKLKDAMEEGMPEVIPGAEVRFYSGIGYLDDLKKLCVQGLDLLLLEMPFEKWTGYMLKEVTDISSSRSVTLMLAHIDRYLKYQSDSVWHQMKKNEILLQANADFYENLFTRLKAIRMTRAGMISAIGSDSHNLTHRAPNISSAAEYIRKKLGDEFLASFDRHSQKLIANNLKSHI